MKRPNQAILLQEQSHQAAENGVKRITIREGHRDYTIGFTLLCCHLANWCMAVNVIAVEHTTLEHVRHADLHSDGFDTRNELLDGLRHFYPNITLQSPVTVVRWVL